MVVVRVDPELKKAMEEVRINWAEYLRSKIRERIELERRRKLAEELLEYLRSEAPEVAHVSLEEVLKEAKLR